MNKVTDKRYPLRVDPEIYRAAKSKAVYEGISMKDLFTLLLSKYVEGELEVKEGREE